MTNHHLFMFKLCETDGGLLAAGSTIGLKMLERCALRLMRVLQGDLDQLGLNTLTVAAVGGQGDWVWLWVPASPTATAFWLEL